MAFVKEIMVTKLLRVHGVRVFAVISVSVPNLVPEETTRNVDLLTPNNYNFLTGENLLRDN
jgi:hypothetical protein